MRESTYHRFCCVFLIMFVVAFLFPCFSFFCSFSVAGYKYLSLAIQPRNLGFDQRMLLELPRNTGEQNQEKEKDRTSI